MKDRMIYRFAVVLIILLGPMLRLDAQISYGGSPRAGIKDILQLELALIKKPVTEEESKTSNLSENMDHSPLIYAHSRNVKYSSRSTGSLRNMDGGKLWLQRIKSEGALNLSLYFNKFYLAEGAEVYIYDLDKEYVLGAYTNRNNKESGSLAIQPVPGDELIVEAYFPGDTYDMSDLEMESVGHGVIDIFSIAGERDGRFGSSADCNVNINCFGSYWQDMKRSVVRLTIYHSDGGWGMCSGVLVNNTASDSLPYILTAQHCVENSYQANSVVAVFDYESVNCKSTVDGYTNKSVSSSILRSSNSRLDFSLLEMREKIPLTYEPYFAGWDISGESPTMTGSIHHPMGDVKKISQSFGPLETGYPHSFGYDTNAFWYIQSWSTGITEPGSSGGPLFTNEQYLIGTLTVGASSCNYRGGDYYQKLYDSWDNYSQDSMQLKKWLDPLGTGEEKLESMDVLTSVDPGYDFNNENILSVFPNPSYGSVNIKLNKQAKGSTGMQLYNLSGKLLLSEQFDGQTGYIDLSSFDRGMYIMRFQQGDEIIIKKLSLLK